MCHAISLWLGACRVPNLHRQLIFTLEGLQRHHAQMAMALHALESDGNP
jgi:hypothetical protein